MENKFKRFLSLLLALVMVFGMIPTGHIHAHAEEVKFWTLGEKVTSLEELTGVPTLWQQQALARR